MPGYGTRAVGPASHQRTRCKRSTRPRMPIHRPPKPGPAPGLWISLGTVLAQPGGYPHKKAVPQSCCLSAPGFVQPAAQTLRRRKPAPAFRKKGLSTETGLLYYYCYLSIKLLKNNQNRHFGAPFTLCETQEGGDSGPIRRTDQKTGGDSIRRRDLDGANTCVWPGRMPRAGTMGALHRTPLATQLIAKKAYPMRA